jgi:hypothetical protein
MASLDSELYELDRNRNTCVLTRATPPDVLAPGTPRLLIGFAASPNGSVGGSDAVVMQKALQDSRRTVRAAIDTLTLVAGKLRLGNEIWTEQESKAAAAAVLWLRTDSPNTPEAKRRIAGIITSAVELLRRSLSVRTSKGGDPILQRAPIWPHAVSFGDPDLGILCGQPFFTTDGPNCRRDVITHEFLHLVGVHHGGGGSMDATPRSVILTPAQALDSADNLAQLVAEVTTHNERTDACARAGE